MKGGAFLKGKEGRVGFRKTSLMVKKDGIILERISLTPIRPISCFVDDARFIYLYRMPCPFRHLAGIHPILRIKMNSDDDISPLLYHVVEHWAFFGFDHLRLYEDHSSGASEDSPLPWQKKSLFL